MTAQSMPPVVFLQGKKVYLRPPQESDLTLFLRWFNDPEIRPLVSRCFPLHELEEKEWFQQKHKQRDQFSLVIMTADGMPIGTMGMHDISFTDGTAVTGACIGEKGFWSKGYGTDAKMSLLDYAFNTLRLRKIYSRVIAYNGRSIRYSEKCGYAEEARLTDHFFRGGKFHDLVLLSVTGERFAPLWREWKQS